MEKGVNVWRGKPLRWWNSFCFNTVNSMLYGNTEKMYAWQKLHSLSWKRGWSQQLCLLPYYSILLKSDLYFDEIVHHWPGITQIIAFLCVCRCSFLRRYQNRFFSARSLLWTLVYLLIASILEMQVVAFGPLFLICCSKSSSFNFIEFVSSFQLRFAIWVILNDQIIDLKT